MPDFVFGIDDFSRTLAEELGCEYREWENVPYPDGEPCVKVLADYEEVKGRDVVVVSRLEYPTKPEELTKNLHDLTRVISNLSDPEIYSAKVDVLMPWLVFSRQDKLPTLHDRDRGKDIGIKSFIKTLKGNGASRLVTFNPHFHLSEGSFQEYSLDIVSLSGVHAIGRYYQERELEPDTLVIGRDEKAGVMARQLCEMLGLEWTTLEKERLTATEVNYKGKYDVKGRDVIAIDDLTTGAGVHAFLDNLINPGDVYFSVVHSTFSPEGYKTVHNLLRDNAIRDYITTNTTKNEFSQADVIPELVKFYKS